jgi:hypothetical protein
MALKKIIFKPGVNRENTRYTTEGGWYECDKVRFRQGTPEKLGGWTQYSSSTFLGICRSLWNWITLIGLNVVSLGTNLKFYIESGGTYYDITPIRFTTATAIVNNPFDTVNASPIITVNDAGSDVNDGDFVDISGVVAPVSGIPITQINARHAVTRINANSYTITVTTGANATATGVGGSVDFDYIYYVVELINAYSTTNGSTTVNVSDNGNGCITGDFVTLSPSVTFNGVTIFGEYQVNVIDPNNYTIQAATAANATGSYTGTTYAEYQINIGPEIQVPRTGWGAGPWGLGGWGVGQAGDVELRLWSQSNWGEDLIFNSRSGGIYYWTASTGLNERGVNITTLEGSSDAPIIANYIDVSDTSRFVFAFGCNDYGATALDPMLIRWSDQESVTDWTPRATNQAGSLRLSHGSEIASAWQVRQEFVVFTDSAAYSLQYLGPPAVWGSQLLGDNISIVGPNAVALASGVLYWMGKDKFYKYDGSISTLSCDLRQYIFSDINLDQGSQIFATTSEGFNEVWWFYCTSGSDTVDRYVIYNYLENIWYYGQMGRTAGLDSGLRNFPIAATYEHNLVYHEDGTDDGTLVPAVPFNSYIQSSEFDIDDGHNFGFIYRILPDITFRGSNTANGIEPSVTMTLIPLQNSGSGYNNPASVGGIDYAEITRATRVPVETFTGQVFVRVRGRQMVFKVEGDQLGLQWQLGAPRIDIKADGRRGNT